MPIKPIVLQRRQAELGRIRLGQKLEASNGKTRPAKLQTFRFTSPHKSYVDDLAVLYGGTARPWDNNGKPEFEVITEASSIPVIVVKGGLSQWMETWSGGGVVHRCDGEMNFTNETPIPCDPNDRAHQQAKPTTRLSVMLPELEAIGAFRMETHGWNAAAEIPTVAELAQLVGDLVPANLHLVERRAVKDGQTSRFVVPVLDLQIGAARLREIVAERSGLTAVGSGAAPSGAPELEQGKPALEQPAPSREELPDYPGMARAAGTLDDWRGVWDKARAAGHLTEGLKGILTGIGNELKARAASTPQEPAADEDGVVDAEIVPDTPTAGAAPGDVGALLQEVITLGGTKGMDMWDIEAAYAEANGGLVLHEASAEQLTAFRTVLEERAA